MWDGQVAQEDPDIRELRKQFVCARITRMNGIDIERFQFDFDTTWTAFFTDEQLNIYSRYGGRDAGEPEDRMSKESLQQTMRAVLDVHSRREVLAQLSDRPLTHPNPERSSTPEDIPLLKKNHRGCVHCHQVREYQLLQWSHDGQFKRDKLFTFPLPENVGLELDRSHGCRVQGVLPGSPAAESGLKPGDLLVQVGDVPIRSEYDFRWALERQAEDEFVSVDVERSNQGEAESHSFRLTLPADWRQTDLSWRKSMRSIPFPLGFRGYALTPLQRKAEELGEDQLAVKVISVSSNGLAENVGLKKQDIIVSLEDRTRYRTFDQFRSDLLLRYRPGDEVRLSVRRDGRLIELMGPFPDWATEETSVP